MDDNKKFSPSVGALIFSLGLIILISSALIRIGKLFPNDCKDPKILRKDVKYYFTDLDKPPQIRYTTILDCGSYELTLDTKKQIFEVLK